MGLLKGTARKLRVEASIYRPLRFDEFAVQKYLLRGHTCRSIFDVGGHVGLVAETYANLFPEAEIYSLEPYPPSYQIMEKRLGENPRFHLVRAAVSSPREKPVFTQTGIRLQTRYCRPAMDALSPTR